MTLSINAAKEFKTPNRDLRRAIDDIKITNGKAYAGKPFWLQPNNGGVKPVQLEK